ncbi:MAG: hypothetical protein OZSIB_1790 [Candidatus Ozemobacter sibiricus]|uniref:TolB protein n=1 Tax=Candidatus Ozemobacter sibiricus TaxID=2268124 RepID=A0A367ZL88_9BACT|nr:MAG: hypothetical protein OZSIB_1790 [Candidatus Ozemobacter sibiricus]
MSGRSFWLLMVLVVLGLLVVESALLAAPRCLFTGQPAGNRDLYLADLATLKATALTTEPSHEEQPALSPDGRHVVFVSDRSGSPQLYLASFGAALGPWVPLTEPATGAWAHPAFAPDGRSVIARFAPDVRRRLSSTSLVLVDLATRQTSTIVESASFSSGPGEGPTVVVDHPAWLDAETLIFIKSELTDVEAPRVTSATLFRYDLKAGKAVRLTGGESYYDANGNPRGFMAGLPAVRPARATEPADIVFVAMQGRLDRMPMTVSRDGKDKRVLPLPTEGFFGPALWHPAGWVFGTIDEAGIPGLAFLPVGRGAAIRHLPFPGAVTDPVLVP